jgi:hypothetical protein
VRRRLRPSVDRRRHEASRFPPWASSNCIAPFRLRRSACGRCRAHIDMSRVCLPPAHLRSHHVRRNLGPILADARQTAAASTPRTYSQCSNGRAACRRRCGYRDLADRANPSNPRGPRGVDCRPWAPNGALKWPTRTDDPCRQDVAAWRGPDRSDPPRSVGTSVPPHTATTYLDPRTASRTRIGRRLSDGGVPGPRASALGCDEVTAYPCVSRRSSRREGSQRCGRQ